jgi:uncharacterized protein (UPF0276 family)
MDEWEFLEALCKRSGCGLLLDVNNVYVSAQNLGFSADEYIARIPMEFVRQIHLAGHSKGETLLIDTHDSPVCEPVWDLFAAVMTRADPVAVMIERDDKIPEVDVLLDELAMARSLAEQGRPA